ncbi:MAG: hypothetical protein ACKVY0_08530 [Prosthecobacter sp.]|uniref:hypothetical protein n=1 Tax=Prosthecobacter sp. TaxID=1965333 RepID=UPI0039044C63
MNADVPSLSLSWLDELEKRLLADVEMVRQMKAKLQQGTAPPSVAEASAPVPMPAPPPPPPPPHPNRAISDVTVAVRTVIATFSGPFGIGEVKRQLAVQHFREFGDSTIRSTLQDLKEAGEILLTQRGIGRGGNRYARPAPASPPVAAGAAATTAPE